ncbi:MAG: hypothetical protein WBG42_04615 [Cryomorphaceae bacterium]
MQIERKNNEIIIRLPENTDTIGVQRLLDFLKYKEIVSKSIASEQDIENLANESTADWWSKNKDRFIK